MQETQKKTMIYFLVLAVLKFDNLVFVDLSAHTKHVSLPMTLHLLNVI